MSFIYGALQAPLGLNGAALEPGGRTVKQYREEKRRKKAKTELQLPSSGYSSPNYGTISDGVNGKSKGKRKGLVEQTIMEEMDSDY